MTGDPFGGDSSGQLSLGAAEGDEALDAKRYADAVSVGAGGMGRVESVTDQHLDRQVARKTVLDPSLVPRLLREARLTARLDHPNIVTVHDVGTGEDGLAYYTMRLVRGRSLGACVTQEGAGLRWVDAVRTTAAAMAYAHEQDVVHRDLKPDNIMVGPLGEVVVVDWGLALATGEEDALGGVSSPGKRLTRVGDVVGTPAYMAPEQAAGQPLDGRADVFSLGRILAEVLGDALLEHVELAAIVDCATHPSPDERYPTAADLAADLDAWREGQRVRAHDYTLSELLGNRLRAWRGRLIRIGMAGALVLAVVGYLVGRVLVEGQRAEQAERRTRVVLAETLAEQAEAALRSGDVTGARRLVTRSVAAHPVARALGVSMALPEQGPAHVVAEPGCESVVIHPSGEPIVCVADDVTVYSASGEVLARHPRPVAVGFGRNGLLRRDAHGVGLMGGETLIGADRVNGRFVGPLPGLDVAMADSRMLHLVQDGQRVKLPCPDGSALLDAVAIDDGWVATCAGGSLLYGTGMVVTDEEWVVDARLSAVAVLPDGGRALGTLDHELFLVSGDGGVRRVELPDVGPVSRVVASPSGARVLVSFAVGRHMVIRVQDGALLDAVDTAAAVFADDATVRAIGQSWVDIALAGQPSWVVAPHGVGSVLLHQGTRWYGTGEGVVGQWSDAGTRLDHLGLSTVKNLVPLAGNVYAPLSMDGVFVWDNEWNQRSDLQSRDVAMTESGLQIFGWGGVVETLTADGPVRGRTTVERRLVARDIVLERHTGNRLVLNGVDVGVFEGPAHVADGIAAAISRGRLTRWSAQDDSLSTVQVGGSATALAVSDDRSVVGYMDGTLRLFDRDGVELAVARVHQERISSLDMSGDTLLSGGWDKRVQAWDLSVIPSP